MPIEPTYRYGTTDYNQMAVKPADNDGMCFFDTSEDRLMTMYYGTLKSFFVKTDEPTNITADHEIQTGYNLYFGSSAEGRVQYNGLDMIIGLTSMASTGKLKLQCNSIDYLTINPVNSSIAIDSRVLNYDGASGQGFTFDNLNRPVLLSTLQMNAGIATKTQNISYSGTLNTGLEFSASNIAYFMQQLTCNGLFEIVDKMKTNGNWISFSGTVNAGVRILASHQVECSHDLSCGGLFSAINGVTTDGDVNAQGSVWGFVDGGGQYLKLDYGTATPATIFSKARIWVDPTNAVRIRHSNGTIQTFTLTTP